jgi:hypothetical protein
MRRREEREERERASESVKEESVSDGIQAISRGTVPLSMF